MSAVGNAVALFLLVVESAFLVVLGIAFGMLTLILMGMGIAYAIHRWTGGRPA